MALKCNKCGGIIPDITGLGGNVLAGCESHSKPETNIGRTSIMPPAKKPTLAKSSLPREAAKGAVPSSDNLPPVICGACRFETTSTRTMNDHLEKEHAVVIEHNSKDSEATTDTASMPSTPPNTALDLYTLAYLNGKNGFNNFEKFEQVLNAWAEKEMLAIIGEDKPVDNLIDDVEMWRRTQNSLRAELRASIKQRFEGK